MDCASFGVIFLYSANGRSVSPTDGVSDTTGCSDPEALTDGVSDTAGRSDPEVMGLSVADGCSSSGVFDALQAVDSAKKSSITAVNALLDFICKSIPFASPDTDRSHFSGVIHPSRKKPVQLPL